MRSPRIPLPLAVYVLWLVPSPTAAGDFSFYATLRAGLPAGADWEMDLGTNSAASQSTGSFQWGTGSSHWRPGNQPQNFQIGYLASSQSAYVTVWDSTNTPWTTQLTNTGPALSANAMWTFPVSNFFVSSSAGSGAQPRSVNVENLTLSSGVQVLSGSLPVSLGVTTAPAFNAPMAAPLVINPAANGGNWFIDGTIRFSGLTSLGGNAQGSQLQFFLQASGTDTPEGQTFLMAGLGLILAGFYSRARNKSKP